VEKIFPVYWIVLFVTVTSIVCFPSALRYLPHTVNFDATFLKEVFLITPATAFVPQAWSMVFEVSFYALVSFIIFVVPQRIMETIIVGVFGLSIVDLLPMPQAPWIFQNPLVIEFGLGVMVAYLIRQGIISVFWPFCIILSGALFAYAASQTTAVVWVSGMQRVATFGFGSALAIYGVVAAELRGITFPRALQYLGAMSYSLYVWHLLILMWLATTADIWWIAWIPGPIQLMAWLVVALAVSAGSYECIERPVLRWARAKRINGRAIAVS
jgi:exopolysaccharide production protein ExoZ